MIRRAYRPVARAMVVGCLVAGCWAQPTARAQDQPHPPIELDLQRIIATAGNGAQGERFQDDVWDLRPEPGRRTVLLPIRVTTGSEAYELSRPTIGLRSARFVGWYVPEQASQQQGGRPNNDDTIRVGDSRDLGALLLGEDAPDDRGRDELASQADALDAATDGSAYDPVLEGAPRLARKLMIYPDGSVGWEMDRAFNGAEPRAASQGNLYGYKLDPEAIRNEEPPRPERLVRQQGEASREFSARRREQQETYRDEQQAYRELRDTVRELPEEYREPGTGVVFAVFDAPDRDEWTYTGDTPLPWEVSRQDLDAISDLARGARGGNGEGLDAQTDETVRALAGLAQRGGVMDQRAIALAAYMGGLADYVVANGEGYRLLRTLAGSPDDQTRAITLGAIARVQPPSRASAQLLADAARNETGEMAEMLQLAAMRSAFRIEAGEGGNTGLLLTQVNDALGRAGGPPPSQVLEEVIDALEPAESSGRTGGSDSTAQATLLTQIEFDRIGDDMLPGVIAMIIRRSPDSTLAAGWLDQQLLRSADTARTDLTLRLLSQADASSSLIQPITDEIQDLVFGPNPDDAGRPRLTLDGVIPLDSAQHGVIAALTSGDAERRALAWEVLRHFELVGGDSAGQEGVREVFDRIVDIGLDVTSHPSTPPSVVDFIDNQNDSALAEHARGRMLELLSTEGVATAAAQRAARRIVSSGHDYRQALSGMEPADRAVLVSRVYFLMTGEVPAVVGLIGDSGRRDLADWLAEQWQAGRLPDEAAWAQAAGDHEQLIRLIGSVDPGIAGGAAAALVLRAGGTAQQQDDFVQTALTLSDRSPEGVLAAWEPFRRDIFAEHLSDAAGQYRMTLNVYSVTSGSPAAEPARQDPGSGSAGGRGGRAPGRLVEPGLQPGGRAPARGAETPAAPRELLATYDLGIVQLRVQGGEVALSMDAVPIRLAEERLALRIDDASTLATFPTPGLDELPLSQLTGPIDLLPTDADTWVGTIELPDGRSLEVTLARER